MMKKYIVSAILATILASCSTDENLVPQNVLPADGEICISTQVKQLVMSRAGAGTMPYEGTTLGLYIRPTAMTNWEYNETTNRYTYPNTLFEKSGNGLWQQTQYVPMLWKGENIEYEYYAYAPAQANVVDGKVAFDLTNQATKQEIENDFLWAHQSGVVKNLLTDQKLNVEFDHALCKVAAEITLADEFYQSQNLADNPIQSIQISSKQVCGKLDVFGGDIVDAQAGYLSFPVTGIHTPGSAVSSGTYTSPYIFYTPGNEQFVITVVSKSGRTFTYTHSAEYVFERGKQYLIKLIVGKDVVRMGGITISWWTDVLGGKLETE